MSGSDDFNVYIWEVPDEWADQDKLITVGRAFLVLRGHRSIVNQVRFNSASHMLISAGVEKVLKVGRQKLGFLYRKLGNYVCPPLISRQDLLNRLSV